MRIRQTIRKAWELTKRAAERTTVWVVDYFDPLLIAVFFLSLIFIGWIIHANAFSLGYEAGQVDAIRGTIQYELQTQPNGEQHWMKIEEK